VVQAGDARFRHLHARPGAARDLADACRERYGRAGVGAHPARAGLTEGWLGGPGPGPAAARVGDVVLAPFEPVGFVDPALPREQDLRSAHGAPTAAEMLVPCRAARGLWSRRRMTELSFGLTHAAAPSTTRPHSDHD